MSPFDSVKRAGASIISSLRMTVLALANAVRRRRPSELVALAKEGSPLEQLVKGLLSAAFWVLVLAPVLIVPAYYLLLSLK